MEHGNCYHAPALWNSLPKDLRYPSQTSSANLSHTTNDQLLALSASQFHSKLKTLHSRSSGSLDLAFISFHITIIITVSSHFICWTAYCLIVFENKPPSSFHSCLVGFYWHSITFIACFVLFDRFTVYFCYCLHFPSLCVLLCRLLSKSYSCFYCFYR